MNRMRVSHSSFLLAWLPTGAVVLHLLSPAVALGQQEDVNAAETAAARALAVDGVKLAQAGQCKDAIDKLDRSQKLRHSPIVLGHLGECQIGLGKWVEGSESLRKLLRDPLPPDATPNVEQAYQRAAATLKEIKPRIPTVTILVKAARDATLSLKLDGAMIPDTVVGVALPTDPGEHTVEVEAPGFLRSSASFKLDPGAKETVTLDLRRDPFAAATPEPHASLHSSPEPTSTHVTPVTGSLETKRDSGSSKVLAYVSYGVGAAGLAVGVGFGRAAMQAETDLDGRCPGKVCAPELENDLDSAKTKGLLSTIGFGVGVAGVALGTVLLVTSGPSSPSASQTGTGPGNRPTSKRENLRTRASIGLGSVLLSTEF